MSLRLGVPKEIEQGERRVALVPAMAERFIKLGVEVLLETGAGDASHQPDASYKGVTIVPDAASLYQQADVILKGTRVDGIYSADPEKDSTAVRFEKVSFDDVYEKGLNIMDLTAFTLCKENNLPIIVLNLSDRGAVASAIRGERVGTLVS